MAVRKDVPDERKRRPAAAPSYSAKDIQVLEGLEAVRRRPGMYIGTTDLRGLHHLVREVLDNSIDEAMNGTCDRIDLWIHRTNEITVADNGRGIPVGPHPTQKDPRGKPMDALQVVMTILHAGGKFGGAGYKVTGGLHGVGVSVVNALASEMVVEVHRDGKVFTQSYERGKPTSAVRAITKPQLPTPESLPWHQPARVTGTVTRFAPDKEMFPVIEWDPAIITQWLRETAYLNKSLWLGLHDERTGAEESYYFDGGVISFVRHLNRTHENLHPKPIYVERTFENNTIAEVALQYNDTFAEKVYTFANNINTIDGGAHLTGFRTALTRTINAYARKSGALKDSDPNLTSDDVREGLTAVISVKIREPQFEGKPKRGSVMPRSLARSRPRLTTLWASISRRTPRTRGASSRSASRRSGHARRRAKHAISCSARAPSTDSPARQTRRLLGARPREERVDHRGGHLRRRQRKGGRDRRFQAILPLRGKILNVEKARADKMLGNEEIKALITALGTGIGDYFDIKKLRYGRTILLADADVDGSHIRTLLLTLLYRHFRPLVEDGRIYIGQPPLYRLQLGKDVRWAYSDNERDKAIKELKTNARAKRDDRKKAAGEKAAADGDKATARTRRRAAEEAEEQSDVASTNTDEGTDDGKGGREPAIARYKGLGEMNADQLWDTTLNPATRTLRRVTLEDAERADLVFDELMGNEVEGRKKWIMANANKAALDI